MYFVIIYYNQQEFYHLIKLYQHILIFVILQDMKLMLILFILFIRLLNLGIELGLLLYVLLMFLPKVIRYNDTYLYKLFIFTIDQIYFSILGISYHI